jgi:hypothetical protein
MNSSLEPLLDDLCAKQSAKRRSAAKKLRKLAVIDAGPHLLAALRAEIEDTRTWETQYQMIMALGECAYSEAKTCIEELSTRPFEATMVYIALGDALVRLSGGQASKITTVLSLIELERHPMLVDGALRALAMLRLIPNDDEIARILAYGGKLSVNHGNRFWIAAACPGWPRGMVAEFLTETAKSSRTDFQEAVALASSGKYKSWRPL